MMNMKGWVASLTLKNFPCVDIFGQDPATGKNISIQVKTGRESSYNIGIKHNQRDSLDQLIKGPFVFVHIGKGEQVDYYILTKDELINLINTTDDAYFKSRKNPIREDYPMAISLKYFAPYKDKWDSLWK